MDKRPLVLLVFAVLPAAAQLIPVGTAVPKTTLPPVVFVNGYQTYCGSTQFSDTFGGFDRLLQATGRVSLFFDNCTVSGKPSIESLGASFGSFLAALKYTDGTPVTQVDTVAHSMGGLIVRAYLAGMQPDGTFNPPANPGIRKAVFLSTPNFGSFAAAIFGSDAQTKELTLGSTFNFALATWNQGTDDLRGVDALAVAGNGGSVLQNGQPNGDGVSTISSSSLGFAQPGRTRLLPYCHISYTALASLLQPVAAIISPTSICPANAPGIAVGANANDTNVQIVQSFLNGTPDWQAIGQTPQQNPLATSTAGILLRAKSATDQYVTMQSAAVNQTDLTTASSNQTAYNEFANGLNFGGAMASAMATITVNPSSIAQIQQQATILSGTTNVLIAKPGPLIAAVIPAAALIAPRIIAPGTFTSIYGANLASTTMQAASSSFPTSLGGTQVLVNGAAIPLQYVSPGQVNAVLPATLSGLVSLALMNTSGQHAVNVLIEAAAPAIFTADGTAASAVNAVTGAIVAASAPLHAGDYVSLYLTGLGATQPGAGGLQYATLQPSVTVAGAACAVQFAGLSPQFPGVDQVNCQIPPGLGAIPAAPLVITSNGRKSNTATLVLQ